MTSVSLPAMPDFKNDLQDFSWINWSDLAREEARKKVIFEKYMKTHALSEEDQVFCEGIDWHPVDEFPLKEEFLRKFSMKKGEKTLKIDKIEDIWK